MWFSRAIELSRARVVRPQACPLQVSKSSSSLRRYSSRTQQPASDEGGENFWKVPTSDSAFWDAYVATRPNYSASFYNEIYTHHRNHSRGSWSQAHDVGCGAGQVATELCSRFNQVVASDINETHIEVAKNRLSPNLRDRIDFSAVKGEDLHEHYKPESVDCILTAEAMVLMDAPKALQSFHKLLQPGGTLAFWFYGRPTFSDPVLRKSIQPSIDKIMVKNWAKIIQDTSNSRERIFGFKRAADGMASWLDYVDFDHKQWTNIRRIKWNTFATLPFFGEEACGFPVDSVSSIKTGEKSEERHDLDWWKNDWDKKELEKYFEVLFPGFKKANQGGDPEMEELFARIGDAMGSGTTHPFTWPAVLVMATKK